ncbi:hypothetical protein [Sphingobium sp. BHU LFT2]|uniref:hypothetical protein n=1 Tax=Sphingobium sp. BHU LFT2 TaxID=2807634 RepID=UPI0020351348|nr:hypothetical protein [Sphingobium sp. BHU LFT2]
MIIETTSVLTEADWLFARAKLELPISTASLLVAKLAKTYPGFSATGTCSTILTSLSGAAPFSVDIVSAY